MKSSYKESKQTIHILTGYTTSFLLFKINSYFRPVNYTTTNRIYLQSNWGFSGISHVVISFKSPHRQLSHHTSIRLDHHPPTLGQVEHGTNTFRPEAVAHTGSAGSVLSDASDATDVQVFIITGATLGFRFTD